MRSVQRVRARRPACLRSLVFLGLAVGLCASGTAAASSFVTLTPFGTHGANPGINEHWVQVVPTWQGPDYQPGCPKTSSQPNGGTCDGIASIADAQAALALPSGNAALLASVNGVYSGPINYANARFNYDYPGYDGYPTTTLPPLFTNDSYSAASPNPQENYAGELSGYVYVPAGQYNFSVLADDGMQFTLSGAGGASITMSLNGLNPHHPTEFGSKLKFESGLYKYDLIGYNRLQDGVLRLLMGSATGKWEPSLIPGGAFYTSVAPVPLPAAGWLFGSGLIGLVGVARRRVRRTGVAA